MLKKFYRLIPTLCFTSLFPLNVLAQVPDETPTILVTATKHEARIQSLSTSATVITAEEIQSKGHQNVVEILRDIAGFDVVHTGGPGGLSYPQMRGMTGKFMVVLIDGMRVNDPADPNGGVGTLFSHLTTGDIERIEVVRGSQSPLYGSNAAAGVINIITRSGRGTGELKASYEAGSLKSQRINFGYGIQKKGFKFRFNQGITATDGVIDLEIYRNYTTSVKLGYREADKFDWETLVRFTRMEQNFAEFNENYDGEFGGAFWAVQLPDPYQENRFEYTTVANRFKHSIKDTWQQELNLGVSVRNRHSSDPDNGLLGTMTAPYDDFNNFYNKGQAVPVYDTPWGPADYSYQGRNFDIDYRHTFLFSGGNVSDVLSAGLEYLYQDYDQKGYGLGELAESIYTASVYAHNQALFLEDALSLNAGFRYDSHQETDASTTGMVGPAYDIRRAGLILRANVGSAFRAPSVFELFSRHGNPDLDPETSLSYEFGIEKYTLDKKFRLGLSYWFTKADDLIVWATTSPDKMLGQYMNFDKAESKGIEAVMKLRPYRNWRFGFNYTYTDSRKLDKATHTWSRNVQLPFNKLNLNATWMNRRTSVSLDGYLVDGSRLRWNGVDRMDSYFKLDLTGRFPLNKQFTGTVRLLNLLDEDYFEGMGYREAGIGVYAGLELNH